MCSPRAGRTIAFQMCKLKASACGPGARHKHPSPSSAIIRVNHGINVACLRKGADEGLLCGTKQTLIEADA